MRRKVSGTARIPRLSVFRSLKNIYVQLVDDEAGRTILAVSSLSPQPGNSHGQKVEGAKKVGRLLAEKCQEKKIEKIVFDRGGYLYHGRIKALAEGVREGGLKF